MFHLTFTNECNHFQEQKIRNRNHLFSKHNLCNLYLHFIVFDAYQSGHGIAAVDPHPDYSSSKQRMYCQV